MKKELMELLACPACKGALELSIDEEDDKEVIAGRLYCSKCSKDYPIKEGIPDLLPPDSLG